MSIDYSRLWKLLIDKKMTRTELRRKAGFTTSALANMGKGNYVSLEIIEKICTVLECKVEDIVEIKPGE